MTNIKYYNNRPVTVIEKTTENMYLVCANTSGNATGLTGSNFCSPCNIGGNETHTCEEAEYIIEDVLTRTTQDNEVFWVDKRMLRDSYFEQKQNDELLASISDSKKAKSKLEEEIKELENNKIQANGVLDKFTKETEERRVEMEELYKAREEIEAEVEEFRNSLSDVKIASDLGVSISIGVKKFKELLAAEDTLNALELGGVDNWSYYYEALKDVDAERDAKSEIERLFKIELSKND